MIFPLIERLKQNRFLRTVLGVDSRNDLRRINRDIQQLKVQLGRLQMLLTNQQAANLREAEFKAYSQFGEDGIIQYILRHSGKVPPTFIEFGVEDYAEANSRFLLEGCNWRGLIIDGNDDSIRWVREQEYYWRYPLTAIASFITRDNVNRLFTDNRMTGEIGLLSIDIDGNDYWVWDSIHVVDPAIVVAEYNSVFGSRRAVTVPYDPNFQRTRAHSSNLYWGCSLAALTFLANKKGYYLVGCNSAGNNAFYLRRGISQLPEVTNQEAFHDAGFRESRDRNGRLTFLQGMDRLREISAMPLYDVAAQVNLCCGDLETPQDAANGR